jgi:voltage-gated potassium channel
MTMNRGLADQLGLFLHEQLLPHRHTALLVALVVAFAVRPLIGESGFSPIAFSIALVVLMLISLYNVQVDELIGERETLLAQKKKRGRVGWLLAIPAFAERVAIVFTQAHFVIVTGMIFWLLFFAYITWCELRAVLKQKEVTGETISLSISIYLLAALTWGVLYIVLFYAQPSAFSFGSPSAVPRGIEVFPVLVYFSMTTISTVGFGDITPVTLQARYAAVAEGITGQFYLAILVARLVGLYMSRTADQDQGRGSQGEKRAEGNR